MHLVGISFPHVNDEARSKSHKKYVRMEFFSFAYFKGNRNNKNYSYLHVNSSWNKDMRLFIFVTQPTAATYSLIFGCHWLVCHGGGILLSFGSSLASNQEFCLSRKTSAVRSRTIKHGVHQSDSSHNTKAHYFSLYVMQNIPCWNAE